MLRKNLHTCCYCCCCCCCCRNQCWLCCRWSTKKKSVASTETVFPWPIVWIGPKWASVEAVQNSLKIILTYIHKYIHILIQCKSDCPRESGIPIPPVTDCGDTQSVVPWPANRYCTLPWHCTHREAQTQTSQLCTEIDSNVKQIYFEKTFTET